RLAFSGPEVEMVELAAKVHDIGKIRVPDAILLKPGKLTVAERRVMETHARSRFDILRPFSEYAKVLDLVLTHHERYDGLGQRHGSHRSRRPLDALVALAVRDGLVEWSDNQTASGRHPHRPDKAVDQDRSLHHTGAAEHPEMLAGGQDPCSVRVREEDVVE